jgi:hypothetical protein
VAGDLHVADRTQGRVDRIVDLDGRAVVRRIDRPDACPEWFDLF